MYLEDLANVTACEAAVGVVNPSKRILSGDSMAEMSYHDGGIKSHLITSRLITSRPFCYMIADRLS